MRICPGAERTVTACRHEPGFALAVVWVPMTILGTVSHVTPIRLPEGFHQLRPFEVDGTLYERLGVRTLKRMLRRGPATWFNPGLRMPAHRDAASLARLDAAMRNAEASHTISFVVTLLVVGSALARRRWARAVWIVVFDVAINAYPIMLQRYNRARLTTIRQPGTGQLNATGRS